ncbi:hypothetical protein SUDANB145_07395 (plasmid) [Streptomyces sp. enrichment culture]|uniref:hypothetical protein n=1 Tax=Streptomyces sp. enrichment culture TaxID=1795815 RepID=UPI003F5457C4
MSNSTINEPGRLTPAQVAFLALADHCMACPVCWPADLRPASERDRCETAEQLARAHSRLL